MKRLAIIGCPGSGKSTLAFLLGRRSKLPVHHLDQIFWKPGWIKSSDEEFREKHAEIIAEESWIIDGTYSITLPERLERADTVIYLDFPLWLCVFRLLKRIATGFGQARYDMAKGCRERLDIGFLKYAIGYKKNKKPLIEQELMKHKDNTAIYHFKDPKELEKRLLQKASQKT
jgi:adenylate kinase family enzyme